LTHYSADPQTKNWWRDAVIYQLYLRSFADSDGDGIGDIEGLRLRLPYLRDLGVDAIWINPWYESPMADGGYDITDHRRIDPTFGSLKEAEELIFSAKALGLRVIVDLVPNHCSNTHRWFVEALAAGPGSPERNRFWFRPGTGPDGSRPPNDWKSHFGGPAWTRVVEADGLPGEWYLHLYTPQQPDFNWSNAQVQTEFSEILHFWFERGVDGLRIDVADALVKDPDLPNLADCDEGYLPYHDRDEVHQIYREWHKIADCYPGGILVGEMWIPDTSRLANYLQPDELHSVFNFEFLRCPWDAGAFRKVIDLTLEIHEPVGAAPTWVLSNHDVTRHVTRYGRQDTSFDFIDDQVGRMGRWGTTEADGEHPAPSAVRFPPVDIELGTRRAKAAALLTLALPGSVYLYQGEELGLWEVEDIPDDVRQDPIWRRSHYTDPGRDGCRVPLPWSSSGPSFGFSPTDEPWAPPWLPQPAQWGRLSVEAQASDPNSILNLYRSALRIRRASPALRSEHLVWLDAPTGVLSFMRTPAFVCLVNFSDTPVAIANDAAILLASGELPGGLLPPDTAVWLRRHREAE
jgi:alpha-glucosidase